MTSWKGGQPLLPSQKNVRSICLSANHEERSKRGGDTKRKKRQKVSKAKGRHDTGGEALKDGSQWSKKRWAGKSMEAKRDRGWDPNYSFFYGNCINIPERNAEGREDGWEGQDALLVVLK